ncbi:MAG: alpha-glucosidase/alpha-galactosidase [Planctomycetes bacterium]|nr:alpha-glucosidase/alpha-galactosidase [Planctomycetota bacterium]
MPKISFMGAGSTIFAKSILGDSMLTAALHDAHIALYDIDPRRLGESQRMMEVLNANINGGRATISAHCGSEQRRQALKGADFVVNAIQVGGYESTMIDFEVPKRYGLRQTIADTLGIGGIFRTLRTLPVMWDFARDIEEVCPRAWMLNYTNPQATLIMGMSRATPVRCVGLCHSVQGNARGLLSQLGMLDDVKDLHWRVAGINHMAWLLELTDGAADLYPEVTSRTRRLVDDVLAAGGVAAYRAKLEAAHGNVPKRDIPTWRAAGDLVRLKMMLLLGHYITESSEHNAEYMAYWIKSRCPELIELYGIPLDEYPRRMRNQEAAWKKQAADVVDNPNLAHTRGHEYGSYIMEAILTDTPFRIHGNVMNAGLIDNLPAKACVEVACMVDRNGVQPTHVGPLPEQCAAMNVTNINTQILTVEAALNRRKDTLYQAAMLDPHTLAELTLDQIVALCDDLIEAHGDMLPPMT